MHIMHMKNPDDALNKGMLYLERYGMIEQSRNGPVRVGPNPVTSLFADPMYRVSYSPRRDANPFFHLAESMWMLHGENDATWLDQYVSDFSERFAEPDGLMHGAYGYRWRNQFYADQLYVIKNKLIKNPLDRQCVLQMWDCEVDLEGDWKDRPCNTHIYFRVNQGVLDMTVCCRSNDIYWGAYGANVVHMSVLQEYMAAAIGIPMGKYWQISNNYHIYRQVEDQFNARSHHLHDTGYYDPPTTLFKPGDPNDYLIAQVVREPEKMDKTSLIGRYVAPMIIAGKMWRDNPTKAISMLNENCDWHSAGRLWIKRRMKHDTGTNSQ